MNAVNKDGDWEFHLEGPISEKTDVFNHDVRKAKSVTIDMQKVTFINSIGVKNWITWIISIPPSAKIELRNCPFVIISQINMVQGFLPKTARVQSFYAPYVNDAGTELTRHLVRGVDYEYGDATNPPNVAFTEIYKDPKTGKDFEPDFIPDKTTKMLMIV